MDLLTLSRDGLFRKIEVKAKQKRTWPGVKGLAPGDAFLVFVDFAEKTVLERPDFFVLSADDWRQLASRSVTDYLKKHPDRRAYLDEENCPVFPDEPWRGCAVSVAEVSNIEMPGSRSRRLALTSPKQKPDEPAGDEQASEYADQA